MADFSFATMRLDEYDNSKPLPRDLYRFVISGVEQRVSKNTGVDYLRIQLTVVDHERFAGRTRGENFFANKFSGNVFAKLAKLSGVEQEEDETVVEWLTRLSETTPAIVFATTFDVRLDEKYLDNEGNPQEVQDIKWFETQVV